SSFKDPEARMNRRMKATSSSSRRSIHRDCSSRCMIKIVQYLLILCKSFFIFSWKNMMFVAHRGTIITQREPMDAPFSHPGFADIQSWTRECGATKYAKGTKRQTLQSARSSSNG